MPVHARAQHGTRNESGELRKEPRQFRETVASRYSQTKNGGVDYLMW